MSKQGEKDEDELRMPAEEFDRMMRNALGVKPRADQPKPKKQSSKKKPAKPQQ